MSKRQVIVLWIIALVLAGSYFAVQASAGKGYQNQTARSRGDKLLGDFRKEVEQVAGIEVREGEASVRLAKKDGKWVVADRDDYPANDNNVKDLLRTVAEVEVTQGIEADPSLAPRFGMDPEAGDEEERGTELVLRNDAGTELARLTLGKNLEGASDPMSPFGGGGSSGRFVRNHADDSGVYVTSELFPTLNTDPTRWLDSQFLQVEKVKTVSVSEPGKPGTTAWTVTRDDETGDFELEGKKDNEQLDTTALNPLKNLFSYARFEDVVPADEAGDAWNSDQQRQALIETFEGFKYTVTFGPEKVDPKEDEDPEAMPTETGYLMTIAVEAEIPAERKVEEGESEEDAKTKQEAFETRKKELEEKLANTKKLEGRTFKVTKYTVDPLLKDRTGLIKAAPPAATTPPVGGPLAPGASATPNRPRVQAVTPPIAIPPLPTPEDDEAPEE